MCTLQETQSAVIGQNDCPQSSTDSEMDQDKQSDEIQQLPSKESPVLLPLVSSDASINLIPEKAHHPMLLFPPRTFGKQKQSFCLSWYLKYPSLHYQEASDSVLCFHCHVAEKRHLLLTLSKDDAFTTIGFSNWKKAIERFNKHEKVISHRQAVELVEKISHTTKNIGDMLLALIHSRRQKTEKC